MTVRPTLLILAAACVCLTAVGASTLRSREATRSHSAAEARLAALVADAEDIVSLRAGTQTVALGQRPSRDTIAQVAESLAQVGLPSDRLKDLAPQSDIALPARTGDPAYRVQSVRIALEPLTSRQLGEFLAAWQAAPHSWTVTQIELTHAGRDDEAGFRAALSIAALYLADSPPDGTPSPLLETD